MCGENRAKAVGRAEPKKSTRWESPTPPSVSAPGPPTPSDNELLRRPRGSSFRDKKSNADKDGK